MLVLLEEEVASSFDSSTTSSIILSQKVVLKGEEEGNMIPNKHWVVLLLAPIWIQSPRTNRGKRKRKKSETDAKSVLIVGAS